MRLRSLELKDAPFMLEWMHDTDIQQVFAKDMASMTLEDAETFIKDNCTLPIQDRLDGDFDGKSIHFAVAGDEDEYLGTISLKNVDIVTRDAEYAISMRQVAHGTGAAKEATEQLLQLAFEKYHLHRVYLNVLDKNIRARKFYEKCGFVYEGQFRQALLKGDNYMDLNWYSMLDSDYISSRGA